MWRKLSFRGTLPLQDRQLVIRCSADAGVLVLWLWGEARNLNKCMEESWDTLFWSRDGGVDKQHPLTDCSWELHLELPWLC